MSLHSLKEMCRDTNAAVSGSKDEVVERLVDHFLQGLDIAIDEPPPPPPAEPRALDDSSFRALFGSLRGDDLTDILVGIDSSRITGSKETKVGLLESSPFNEATLLDKLTNRALAEILERAGIRTNGPKRDRIDRLVDRFRGRQGVNANSPPADVPPNAERADLDE